MDFHFKTFQQCSLCQTSIQKVLGLSLHPQIWLEISQGEEYKGGLEFLETPGQAGFPMVFCQFPWSMGGYHHLRDAVTAKDVKGWVLCLPSLLSLSLLSLTFSE